MILEVSLSEIVKKRALEAGFDLVGIAPASAWSDLEFSRRWVEAGYGGEMGYLANPKRDDPRHVLPSVQSIVCVGLIYNAPLPYSTEVRKTTGETRAVTSGGLEAANRQRSGAFEDADRKSKTLKPEPRSWISRYAWGKDYHEVMRARLEQLRKHLEALHRNTETRVYVDTGPVIERAFARYSGIGWTGKNTCLINERRGSWFFLGVILTNLILTPDLPTPDRCGSCTRCLEACPTGALMKPYVMDASRCIAYFTIELKGSIPEEFRPAIGNNVFGCDICQDVCPWNSPLKSAQNAAINPRQEARRSAVTTDQPEFQPLEIEIKDQKIANDGTDFSAPEGPQVFGDSHLEPACVSLFNPPLRALASVSEEDFRKTFAHSPVKRAKYRSWLRNLCVAMGNSGDRSFMPWLERMANHPEAVVREHAQWALARLAKEGVG
jgi:epoxyqueuosine reductase